MYPTLGMEITVKKMGLVPTHAEWNSHGCERLPWGQRSYYLLSTYLVPSAVLILYVQYLIQASTHPE